MRQLLDTIGAAAPAFILGRRMDILAWNALAAALITDFAALPAAERNLARLVLLDEKVSRLYPDRRLVVRNAVGYLRLDVGRHSDDEALAALVDELCARRPDFREQWDRHTVQRKRFGVKRFDHPMLGRFELDYETPVEGVAPRRRVSARHGGRAVSRPGFSKAVITGPVSRRNNAGRRY